MASVQLRLDLGQTPKLPKSRDLAAEVWEALDDKARDDLVARLAMLMAASLDAQGRRDE